MRLQGRDISVEMQGGDVKLLQAELGQLAFTIAPGEIEKQLFGPSTYEAVLAFQRQHVNDGLKITGIVPLENLEISGRIGVIFPS